MSNAVIALAAATSLLGGGGGSDAIVPDYLDELAVEQHVMSLDEDAQERLDYYESLGLDEDEALDWFYGEDNRYWGLKDVTESFSSIVAGYTIDPEGVTVWVTSQIKSGGIPALLDEYDVEATVKLVDETSKASDVAFSFVSLGNADYPLATVSKDGQSLVVTAASEEAALAGPMIFGTMIDGVELTFEYQD